MPQAKPKTRVIERVGIRELRQDLSEILHRVYHENTAVVILSGKRELAALVPPTNPENALDLYDVGCLRFTYDDGAADDRNACLLDVSGDQAVLVYCASGAGWTFLSGSRKGDHFELMGWQNGSWDEHKNGERVELTFSARHAQALRLDQTVKHLEATWKTTWRDDESQVRSRKGLAYIERRALIQKAPPEYPEATLIIPSEQIQVQS